MKLKINQKAPEFTLKNDLGDVFSQENLTGKVTVLFFYPKNFTPGCTKQACTFRDSYHIFEELGCQVLGISSDDTTSHQAFQSKYKLPFKTFPDPNNSMRKKFGVPRDLFGLIPGRVSYIFDRQGICKGIFNAQINTKGHIDFALKKAKELI